MSNWVLLSDHKTANYWTGSAVNHYGTLLVEWRAEPYIGGWAGSARIYALPNRTRLHDHPIHENSLLEPYLERLGVRMTSEKDAVTRLREDHEQHTAGLWDRASGLSDEIADLKEEIADLRSQVVALMKP